MLNATQTIAAIENVIKEFRAYLEATYAPTRTEEIKDFLWTLTWGHVSTSPTDEIETFYKELTSYDDETITEVHENFQNK
jgi:hypothetical protein